MSEADASKLPPFQRFLDAHRDAVWRYVALAAGPAEADDCFQETFIAALRAYPRVRAGSNLRAWILTIAQRKVIDAHRARSRRAVALGNAAQHQDRGAPEPASHQPDGVWEAVRRLPERQRAAVTLRFLGDLRHREIAAALGCSEQAARRSLHEGLKRLREAVGT